MRNWCRNDYRRSKDKGSLPAISKTQWTLTMSLRREWWTWHTPEMETRHWSQKLWPQLWPGPDDASEAHACTLCTSIPAIKPIINILLKRAAFFHKVGCVLSLQHLCFMTSSERVSSVPFKMPAGRGCVHSPCTEQILSETPRNEYWLKKKIQGILKDSILAMQREWMQHGAGKMMNFNETLPL